MRERNIDGQERNTHLLPLAHPQPGTWPILQACALTGNRTGDLSVHRPALNPLSHTARASVYFVFVFFNQRTSQGENSEK